MTRHNATWLSHILCCLLCLLGLSRYAIAEPLSPLQVAKPVKIWTVPQAQPHLTIDFSAQIKASEHAQLAFPVMGQIKSLNVHMGQAVKQGQELARLDPTDYQIQLDAKQAEYELAKVRASRAERLFAERLVSEDNRDQAKTALTIAQAQLEQAKTDLADTYLLAPFNGFISLTYQKSHEVTPANKPVLNLMALDQLDIVFDLPNQYMQQAKQLDEIQFLAYFDGDQRRFSAQFKEADLQPDRDTNSYRITLTLPRPEELNLLPGMAASVELLIPQSNADTWALPQGAIVKQQGQQVTVWQINHDYILQPLEVMLDDKGRVISGLSVNSQIVAVGAKALTAGQKVRVWQREGGL